MKFTPYLAIPVLLCLFASRPAFAYVSFAGTIETYDVPATLYLDKIDADSGTLTLDASTVEVDVHIHSVKDSGKYGIDFTLEADGELPKKFDSQELEFNIDGKDADEYRELMREHEREMSRFEDNQ